MGPDQILVLVNGKRRHGSALIHVNTSVGRGTSGYDMNSIPVAAIKRIEVLRDGASAQYGSDAVAGVINVVLKDGEDEGGAMTSYGQTYEGDGGTFIASVGTGTVFENGGKVFFALERRDRERTNRAGLQGTIQYPDTEYFEFGDTAATHYDATANSAAMAKGYGEGTIIVTGDPDGKEAAFDRRQFRIGDASSEQTSGVLTFESPLTDSTDIRVRTTGSHRKNTSGGFYRRANQTSRNPANSDYPDGFLPLINTTITDWSGESEFSHEFGGILGTLDLSVGGGINKFDFRVKNSHNASYANCVRNFDSLTNDEKNACRGNGISAQEDNGAVPSSADAGEFKLSLINANADMRNKYLWGHLAWGLDYRVDTYEISAGEEYSYLDYDGGGTGADGGIQVFPGFSPENEVVEDRHAIGGYVDFERELPQAITINPAVRYEYYSDFGSTINGKLALRANPLWWLTMRASGSSGFRAPSMQQLYFNNRSTQFDSDGKAQEVGTFRNDSAIAKEIGIPELKEERSWNFSGGFMAEPLPGLSFSADFYWIKVNDRIVVSGQIDPFADDADPVVAALEDAFRVAGIGKGQFFMNAADTRTMGVDISASYRFGLFDGIMSLLLNGTINDTEITKIKLPIDLPASLFTPQDRSIVESWQPKDRWSLSSSFEKGMVKATITQHRYGEYTVVDGATKTYGARYPTDVQVGFDLGKIGVFKIGANNIFDITPEKNEIGQARGGTIVDDEGNLIADSPGVFTYSRRSAPFGFNGGYYYVSWEKKI